MMLSIFSSAFIDYLYVFREIPFQVFYPFLNWVIFLLLSYKDSLYILDTIDTYQIYNLQISPTALWLGLFTLIVSIEAQKFLISVKFNLYIFYLVCASTVRHKKSLPNSGS